MSRYACTFVSVLVVMFAWLASAVSAQEPVEIVYGEHPRQVLDLYPAPPETSASGALRPVVVYFHGGGFRHGDKGKVSENLIKRMHDNGIGVAAVNYRFITTDGLPAAMLDGARAVQHLRYISSDYELDPDRIAVLGSSAGAGISLWIALHGDLADADSGDPVAWESSRVTCAYVKNAQVSYDPRFWKQIGLGQVLKNRTLHELYRYPDDAGEDPRLLSLFDLASPITHLSEDDPPVRLDYSFPIDLDETTSVSALIHHPLHGQAFLRACEPLGVSCVLTFVGGPKIDETGYGYLIRMLQEAGEPGGE